MFASLGGCLTSHGLMQTAHTQPPGQVRLKAGFAGVLNELSGTDGRDVTTNTTLEPGVRVGLSDSIDAGVSPWLAAGAILDAKLNVIDNRARAALAPRLAAGYALNPEGSIADGALGLEVGVIGSYKLDAAFEPYAAISFANHWFLSDNVDPDKRLAPTQMFAPRAGYGDGLIKAALGFDIRIDGGWHALVEYGHWFPAQNDPGDGYRLLSNDVVAASVAYELSGD
jgi:hypothetical protein